MDIIKKELYKMSTFTKKKNKKKNTHCPYHPQSSGKVEKSHVTLQLKLVKI